MTSDLVCDLPVVVQLTRGNEKRLAMHIGGNGEALPDSSEKIFDAIRMYHTALEIAGERTDADFRISRDRFNITTLPVPEFYEEAAVGDLFHSLDEGQTAVDGIRAHG